MKIRSDFVYRIESKKEDHPEIVIIQDLDYGRMSVTNDIENVVEFIRTNPEMPKPDINALYIYMDSEGTWDGWDPENEAFVSLNAKDPQSAKEKIIQWNKHKKDNYSY